MTHPTLFINIDSTHHTLAQMASLSIDGLKSLANYYRSSIHQLASKQMTARVFMITSLALVVFSLYQAGTAQKRTESQNWAFIALAAGVSFTTFSIINLVYVIKISDQSFYLNAAQAMLLNRV